MILSIYFPEDGVVVFLIWKKVSFIPSFCLEIAFERINILYQCVNNYVVIAEGAHLCLCSAGIKDTKNLNMTSTLAELGMDSLMGAEIKQALERGFDLVLSVGEIRNLTMEKLLEIQGGSSSDMAPTLKANSQVSFKNEVC